METIVCRGIPVYDYSGGLVMLQIAWNRAQVSTYIRNIDLVLVIKTYCFYFDSGASIMGTIGITCESHD
jgi:hypothetical protein